jgi:hypothetical protein
MFVRIIWTSPRLSNPSSTDATYAEWLQIIPEIRNKREGAKEE